MALKPRRGDALVLRLMGMLALLGWPRVGFAQGMWSGHRAPAEFRRGDLSHGPGGRCCG
jgi:hypothetical protein